MTATLPLSDAYLCLVLLYQSRLCTTTMLLYPIHTAMLITLFNFFPISRTIAKLISIFTKNFSPFCAKPILRAHLHQNSTCTKTRSSSLQPEHRTLKLAQLSSRLFVQLSHLQRKSSPVHHYHPNHYELCQKTHFIPRLITPHKLRSSYNVINEGGLL
jgi:hypothetical protein